MSRTRKLPNGKYLVITTDNIKKMLMHIKDMFTMQIPLNFCILKTTKNIQINIMSLTI